MCPGSPGRRPLSVAPIMSALHHDPFPAPSPLSFSPNVSTNSSLFDATTTSSLVNSLSLMESGGLVVIVDMGLAVLRFYIFILLVIIPLIIVTININILSVVMNLVVLTAMKERELAVGVVTNHRPKQQTQKNCHACIFLYSLIWNQ